MKMLRGKYQSVEKLKKSLSRIVRGCYALFICLSAGCIGFQPQRPFAVTPVKPVFPQSEILTNPTEVTPRSDQQTGKPTPTDSQPRQPAEESLPQLKRDLEFVEPDLTEDPAETNAPVWKPLLAPERQPLDVEPQEIELGKPITKRPSAQADYVTANGGSDGASTTLLELQSTSGRRIEILRLGAGAERILVTGSLYGNDPSSITLMDQTARLLKKGPLPAGVELLLIRTPNPDGMEEHIRTNLQGIDLNRNFPSTYFTANRQTGPYPASEVETQHLLRLLREFRPSRVIHVHEGIGHRPLLLVNERWSQTHPEFSSTHFDRGEFQGAYKVGSIEEFSAVRLGAEVATVQLPPVGFDQLSPQVFAQIILQGKLPFQSREPQQLSPEAKPQGTVAKPAPDGLKGYVQFLPPPPEFLRDPRAVGDQNPLYFELTPPLE